MKFYKIFFLVCFFCLLNEVVSLCKKYNCGSLNQGICYFENTEQNSIMVQNCSNSSEFCPFMNNSNNQISCVSRDGYHPRSFPGGSCEQDSECISGSCQEGLCQGKAKGETCNNHIECLPGMSCRKSSEDSRVCKSQSFENEECEEDFDCLNSYGCFGGKCVAYLSLGLGTFVGSVRNALPLCESGMEYKGACEILTNLNYDCSEDSPCRYKISDGSEVEIKDFCLCGKNPTGNKVCRLGNGASIFSSYIEELKNTLKDTTSCNTVERGICMSHFAQKDINSFLVSRAKALRFHELYNSDECVVNLFFPEIR